MIRLLMLACLLALAACNSQVSGVGQGPLVLHPRAQATFEKWHSGREYLTDMTVAVDKYSRFIGASHCGGGAGNCLDDAGQQAIDLCSKDGQYDCYVFFYDSDIVWNGPVYVRNATVSQSIPYHGRWPVTVDWPGSGVGAAEVVVAYGRRYVLGLHGDARCRSSLIPESADGGRFDISCPDGPSFSGAYRSGSGNSVEGDGRASTGDAFSFVIDMSAGKALQPFSGF